MKLRRLFFSILFVFLSASAFADDPGITKVRLIQLSDSTYQLEADVSQQLIWAIKQPIFPDRFMVSEVEYENRKGWIVATSVATSNSTALGPEDELLLPWLRNGVDLTVQWLDGTIKKGLFIRSLDGIHIPMSQLISEEKTSFDIVKEYSILGFKHFSFYGIHIILVFALLFAAIKSNSIAYLLWFSLGHGLSFILVDFQLPHINLLFVDLLALVLTFLLAYYSHSSLNFKHFTTLFVIFGLLHGLGLFNEISSGEISVEQKRIAQFAAILAIEMGNYTTALIFIVFLKRLKRSKWLSYVPGVLSVCLLLILFNDLVKDGKTQILNQGDQVSATRYELPVAQTGLNTGVVQRGARALTTPIMNYITIEPYEIRMEILILARTAVQMIGIDDRGMKSIPIQSLEPIKNRVLNQITQYNFVQINDNKVSPVLSRADFVTLSSAGVLLRETLQIESLDEGILGLTIVFETKDLADELSLQWNVFPENEPDIETTITDPFGGSVEVISKENNALNWKKKLSSYTVPVVEEVAFQRPRIPFISIFLFIVAIFLFLLKKTGWFKKSGVIVLCIGFVLYPLLRIESGLPVLYRWKPSTENSSMVLERLLTNVYRSFDLRNEEDIYDRLSTSVEGDQLTEIYLQNRRSMELEYRGGAKAKVDELEIEEIGKIAKTEEGNFISKVTWIVGGSVSHFGHTHYRRNLNHAIITFGIVDNHWKIRKIELLDEKRII